jgi:hypothetical protein
MKDASVIRPACTESAAPQHLVEAGVPLMEFIPINEAPVRQILLSVALSPAPPDLSEGHSGRLDWVSGSTGWTELPWFIAQYIYKRS